MKRTTTRRRNWIYTCMLAFLGFSGMQAQTVIWSDNFDAPSGGANNNNAGVGWSGATATPGGGQNTSFLGFENTWAIGANASCSSGNKLYVRSTLQNNNSFISDVFTDKYNATPNISTVGFTNLSLRFTWRCEGTTGQDYGLVGFSGDGGATWNWLTTQYQGQSSCIEATVPIPAQYQNISNFKVAFRFVSNATSCSTCDPPFNVDNIFVEGTGGSTCVPPTVNAGANSSICAGQSFTLGGNPTATGGTPSNYVYSWSPAAGLSSATAANPTVSPTQTTTYTVTVNGGDLTCTASASVTVTVANSQTIAVTADGPLALCAGEDVVLTAASGFTNYVWSNNQTGNSITVNAAGTYSVSADGTGGCDASSEPIAVTVDAPFNISVTPNGPISLCEGETVILNAQAGFSNYQWSNNSNGQTLTVTQAGGYSVSAENGNGCLGSSSIISVNIQPLPVASFTYEQINGDYEVQFTNTSQNATTYSWNFGAGNTSTLANPLFAFDYDAFWPVTLIASNSCGSDTLNTEVETIKTSIPEIEGLNIQLMPNPGSEMLSLRGNSSALRDFHFVVMNMQGQVIFQENKTVQGDFIVAVPMDEFASGAYVVVIATNEARNVMRWIKQ